MKSLWMNMSCNSVCLPYPAAYSSHANTPPLGHASGGPLFCTNLWDWLLPPQVRTLSWVPCSVRGGTKRDGQTSAGLPEALTLSWVPCCVPGRTKQDGQLGAVPHGALGTLYWVPCRARGGTKWDAKTIALPHGVLASFFGMLLIVNVLKHDLLLRR